MFLLATPDASSGRIADAESLLKKIIDIRRRSLGQDHPDTLSARAELATLYMNITHEFAKAEPLLKDVVQARRRVLGPEHRSTLVAMLILGAGYLDQRKA